MFTVIMKSGRAVNYDRNSQGVMGSRAYTYWDILSLVYEEYQSAGSNWDRPNMLLYNGEVVVASGLDKLAWNYGKESYEERAKVEVRVREKHKPEWL